MAVDISPIRMHYQCLQIDSGAFPLIYIYIIIWDSVQLNHPYGTFSKFPEQAKEK